MIRGRSPGKRAWRQVFRQSFFVCGESEPGGVVLPYKKDFLFGHAGRWKSPLGCAVRMAGSVPESKLARESETRTGKSVL